MLAPAYSASGEGGARLLKAITDIDARGLREIRAINKPIAKCSRVWFASCAPYGSLAQLVHDAQGVAERGWDVYFSTNPRSQPRGRRQETMSVVALLADLDSASSWAHVDELTREDVPPSAVVASGSGWHVYYFLAEPISVASGEALNARLALRLEGDNAWDASRCPRLPGTLNWKRHTAVWLYEIDETRRYTPQLLRRRLPSNSPSRVRSNGMHLPTLPKSVRTWQELGVSSRLCEFFGTYGLADRSRVDAAVVIALRRQGADAGVVVEALAAPQRSKLVEKMQTEGQRAASRYVEVTIAFADRVLSRERRSAAQQEVRA